MYDFTFRISRKTEISFLKKEACSFWGLENVEKNLALYDFNGDIVDPSPQDPDKFRLVEYQIEMSQNKEARWKDLQYKQYVGQKDQEKIAIFYLGNRKEFPKNFEMIQDKETERLNKEKDDQKLLEENAAEMDEEGAAEEDNDDAPDAN